MSDLPDELQEDLQDDPEFIQIRNEFIDSLSHRLNQLEISVSQLKTELQTPSHRKDLAKDLNQMRVLIHNLAGVSGSYGFPTLSLIAGCLDSHISLDPENYYRGFIPEGIDFLMEVVSSTRQNRIDPEHYLTDSRMTRLRS